MDCSMHTRLLCPVLSPEVCSNLYPLNRWCYLTILSSPVPFSFHLQSFPASGSSPMNQLFTSCGQSIGTLVSVTDHPMDIQCWFPLLGWLVLFLCSPKGLSRVFSSTTVWKHQFCGTQPSLWSNSRIYTWLLENHSFDHIDLCWQSNVSTFKYAVYVCHSFPSEKHESLNFMVNII